MNYLNLYKTKPTQGDFTLREQYRLTEIEIFLMYQKLKNHAPNKKLDSQFAADTLLTLLNLNNEYPELFMDKLNSFLIRSDKLVPTMDEYIVYLRTQGLGINKITALTKKQHYYLTTLLSKYLTAQLISEIEYDWNWEDYPTIQTTSHYLARDLFQIHNQEFHTTLDFTFPKVKKPRNTVPKVQKWF